MHHVIRIPATGMCECYYYTLRRLFETDTKENASQLCAVLLLVLLLPHLCHTLMPVDAQFQLASTRRTRI